MTSRAWTASRLRIAGWSLAALALLLPLVAMQFTDEVAWDALDFIAAGALLAAAGVGLELAARLRRRGWRVALAIAVVTAFLLIWAQLAVGIV